MDNFRGAATKWREMQSPDKAEFEALAEADKKRYKDEMDEHLKSQKLMMDNGAADPWNHQKFLIEQSPLFRPLYMQWCFQNQQRPNLQPKGPIPRVSKPAEPASFGSSSSSTSSLTTSGNIIGSDRNNPEF